MSADANRANTPRPAIFTAEKPRSASYKLSEKARRNDRICVLFCS